MEYLFLALFIWVLLSLPALIYAVVVESRRSRDAEKFSRKIEELTRELELLEQRTRVVTMESERAPAAEVPPPVVVREAPKPPAPAIERPGLATPLPPRPEPIVEKPEPPVAPAPPLPAAPPAPPPPSLVERKAPAPPPLSAPPAPKEVVPAVSAAATPPPQLAPEEKVSARVQAPAPPPFRHVPPPTFSQIGASAPAKPALKKKSISFEEALGTNWFPKLGITAVVIGVGFLVGASWATFAPWLRVLILYAGGLGLLAGGIFLERKEQYRILGRSLVGGGWAVTFLVTYSISHAQSLLVLQSQRVDLFLMLAVAGVMVWHTLKYDSQLVTGIAFLLGFSAVALNPDPPFNLIAGAILVSGMTVIVLRRRWFELEVFGILASYLNHAIWLYPIIEAMGNQKHSFPEFGSSVALLGFYWAIFRVSYLLRTPAGRQQESVSTVAGLLNPLLLLAVMKYQSFRPELAFYALLVLGAVEFTLGQLPAARRRLAPFRILSSLGAALMIAAVPFKYSGNALEMLWLAGAETFLLAGVFTRERLFRGFGLIVSFLVALYAISFRMEIFVQEIINGQPHYHAQLGLVFAVIAATLYANAHITRWFWPKLFENQLERQALAVLSFAASFFSVAATFVLVTDAWVAPVLAAFLSVLSWTGSRFQISEMVYESHWIAALAALQVILWGRNQTSQWHGVPYRFVMFVPLAALLYFSSRFVRLSETKGRTILPVLYTWVATALLALLIWFQMPDWSIVLLWLALGLTLCAAAELFRQSDFKWQAFVLALLSFGRALAFNFTLTATTHHMSYRLITVSLSAAGIYLLARWTPRPELRPVYSVLGTFLLAYLAFQEAPQPWTAVAWITLAAALSIAARCWKDRALLWQTHLLSALAAVWTLYANFAPQYRGTHVQLISVGITAILLYLLTWTTNIRDVVEDARICQGYSWAASLLLSWLAWYQLDPANVSLAWGIFGLLLFEVPDLARFGQGLSAGNLRAQACVALVSSFVHLFYSNFNARVTGTWPQIAADPRVLTVLPLVAVFFWVYGRLHSMNQPSLPATANVAGKGESR